MFDSNTVTGNTATIPGGLDHPGNYGGGIYALADSGGALTLSNSTVSSNFGGGVNFLVSYGSDGEISDSVVSGNTGSTIDGGGGGQPFTGQCEHNEDYAAVDGASDLPDCGSNDGDVWLAKCAVTASTMNSNTDRPCIRQVSETVRIRSINRLPLALCVPKLSLR